MCLAQAHNAVTPVRLEPTTPRSREKHSTTESMRSLSRVDEMKLMIFDSQHKRCRKNKCKFTPKKVAVKH